MSDYEAGYRAFSEDTGGFIAQAVQRHFAGVKRLEKSDEWFTGYQDATDDFNNAQAGGE
jgi:hypothetical protein